MKVFLSLIVWLLISIQAQAQISVGADSFIFPDKGKNIKVWYYNPSESLDKNTPIVFVMHGIKRDAKEYRDTWIQYAQEKGFLLLVPEFNDEDFYDQRYALGNMIGDGGKINDKENLTFFIIEKIFNHVKAEANLQTPKYYLYGYSAGAQFVHRFVAFFPDASLELAIAANAGFYTFLDQDIAFPYGIKNMGLGENELKALFAKKLIILLGDKDTDMFAKNLKNTPQAKNQGRYRFERGNNYFETAKKLAEKLETPFNWEIAYVEGVGHSNKGMAKKAQEYIK